MIQPSTQKLKVKQKRLPKFKLHARSHCGTQVALELDLVDEGETDDGSGTPNSTPPISREVPTDTYEDRSFVTDTNEDRSFAAH